ncbi:hypothetical protein GCM10009838_21930 [Catenulispora subtropica]|uniref:Uncharacterized protein n=1 Tax=Catenulispora subtropica TaxID=450798 RepID=A0ABN2R638_9ACTN
MSLGIRLYAHVHTPAGLAVNVAGFSGPLPAKAWLTTIAIKVADGQISLA